MDIKDIKFGEKYYFLSMNENGDIKAQYLQVDSISDTTITTENNWLWNKETLANCVFANPESAKQGTRDAYQVMLDFHNMEAAKYSMRIAKLKKEQNDDSIQDNNGKFSNSN